MRTLILTSILLLSVVGCGDHVAPVSGRVTLDQKPLKNATIIFFPDSTSKEPGPGSQAKTDEDGRYMLRLMTRDMAGAMVGKHKVTITAYEGDNGSIPSSAPDMGPFRKLLVPSRYNSNTELTFDVPPGGSTAADFDLKSN